MRLLLGQRAGEQHARPLAAGQLVDRRGRPDAPHPWRPWQPRWRPVGGAVAGPGRAVRQAAERHHRARAERPVHGALLRQVGEARGPAPRRSSTADRAAVERDAAAGSPARRPASALQQRRLAGAVRADEAGDSAGREASPRRRSSTSAAAEPRRRCASRRRASWRELRRGSRPPARGTTACRAARSARRGAVRRRASRGAARCRRRAPGWRRRAGSPAAAATADGRPAGAADAARPGRRSRWCRQPPSPRRPPAPRRRRPGSRSVPRSMPRLAAASSPSVSASSAGPSRSSSAMPASMNGPASQTCVMLRSASEPSSQNTISTAANGLGDRLSASEISAVATLDTATPARISVRAPPRSPASSSTSDVAMRRRACPPSGSASAKARRGAGVDRQHRAEPRAAGDADDARLRQRIAQIALQRRAREPERSPDQHRRAASRGRRISRQDQPCSRARQPEARRADQQRQQPQAPSERSQPSEQQAEHARRRRVRPRCGAGSSWRRTGRERRQSRWRCAASRSTASATWVCRRASAATAARSRRSAGAAPRVPDGAGCRQPRSGTRRQARSGSSRSGGLATSASSGSVPPASEAEVPAHDCESQAQRAPRRRDCPVPRRAR